MKGKLIKFLSSSPTGSPRTCCWKEAESLRKSGTEHGSQIPVCGDTSSQANMNEQGKGPSPSPWSYFNICVFLQVWWLQYNRNIIVRTHLCIFLSTAPYLAPTPCKVLWSLLWVWALEWTTQLISILNHEGKRVRPVKASLAYNGTFHLKTSIFKKFLASMAFLGIYQNHFHVFFELCPTFSDMLIGHSVAGRRVGLGEWAECT